MMTKKPYGTKNRTGMSLHAIKHVTELMADGKERSVQHILNELFEKPMNTPSGTRTRKNTIPTRWELRRFFHCNNYTKRTVRKSELLPDGSTHTYYEPIYRVRDEN